MMCTQLCSIHVLLLFQLDRKMLNVRDLRINVSILLEYCPSSLDPLRDIAVLTQTYNNMCYYTLQMITSIQIVYPSNTRLHTYSFQEYSSDRYRCSLVCLSRAYRF